MGRRARTRGRFPFTSQPCPADLGWSHGSTPSFAAASADVKTVADGTEDRESGPGGLEAGAER
jgi:hypothetical protein